MTARAASKAADEALKLADEAIASGYLGRSATAAEVATAYALVAIAHRLEVIGEAAWILAHKP